MQRGGGDTILSSQHWLLISCDTTNYLCDNDGYENTLSIVDTGIAM